MITIAFAAYIRIFIRRGFIADGVGLQPDAGAHRRAVAEYRRLGLHFLGQDESFHYWLNHRTLSYKNTLTDIPRVISVA